MLVKIKQKRSTKFANNIVQRKFLLENRNSITDDVKSEYY